VQGQTSSYVLTTVVTAPASAGLTTLANVHDELNIPTTDVSNDPFLTRAITQESAAIARYCNRTFGLATYQDTFRPQRGIWGEGTEGKTNPLVLARWPLILGTLGSATPAAPVLFTGNTHSNTTLDGIVGEVAPVVPPALSVVPATFTASFTAAIAGTTMTVSAVASGQLAVGQTIGGAGVAAGTVITAGPAAGGPGSYTVSVSQNVGSETMAALNLQAGQLVSGPGLPAGTTITAVNALTASITLSQAATVTSTTTQPFSTGISVVETVAQVDTGLTLATDFEVDGGNPQPGDEGTSRLYRLNQQFNPKNWPASKIVVVYQAGYGLPNDPVPTMASDLENACLRLVTARFRARSRDPMLMERNQPQTLGTERYWVGGAPGQEGAFAPEVLALIEPYRVPVTA
jgi:hypothetical protein